MPNLIREAKRRKVAAVIVWYAVASWALIQVADVVGPALSLPGETVRYLVIAAVAGLPLAILLAWVFDITPEGVKRTPRKLNPKSMAEGVPRVPEAYELYLRANQTGTRSGEWDKAIDAYRKCLELDPTYAPAWARMARCYRLIAKFTVDDVESEKQLDQARRCFARSLELNPDLPLTHSLFAQLEIDTGKPEDAMIRLLARAEVGGADAEIFAGLVQAFRFVGLLEESLAAYEAAQALDPNVRTGVAHTYFMLGRYEEALNVYKNADVGYLEALALAMLNRGDEAIALLRARDAGNLVAPYIGSLRALLEGNRAEAIALIGETPHGSLARDGEAIFYMARQYAYLGESEAALEFLQHSIIQGFVCYPRFANDPWLDPLRDTNRFKGLMRAAETRHKQARESFVAAGGQRVLTAG